jgi:hypothetical protein
MKNTDKIQHLTEQEHNFIKEGSANYTKLKIALGEIELQKQGLLAQAKLIVESFNDNEKKLIEKYGPKAVINMQTGEVSQKEE